MMDWLQFITTSGALGALGLALATYLKTRPAMKLATLKGEEGLWARIATLERAQEVEREECRTKIATLEAKVADLQHDLTNETMSFDAFLMLAESNPEKVLEQIPRIKEMRAAHKERMAIKRGVREGTVITEKKS